MDSFTLIHPSSIGFVELISADKANTASGGAFSGAKSYLLLGVSREIKKFSAHAALATIRSANFLYVLPLGKLF